MGSRYSSECERCGADLPIYNYATVLLGSQVHAYLCQSCITAWEEALLESENYRAYLRLKDREMMIVAKTHYDGVDRATDLDMISGENIALVRENNQTAKEWIKAGRPA